MKITVLDASPGSGKTNTLIEMMDTLPYYTRIIYITPLLTECHRIAGTVFESDDPYKRPINIISEDAISTEHLYIDDHCLSKRRFKHPNNIKNSTKLDDINYLIENGCNIVSTHSLFTNFNNKIMDKLKEQNYILVLDEVISIYEQADDIISSKEAKQLIKSRVLYVDDDKFTLKFNTDKFQFTDDTRFSEIANLCELGQLLLVDESVVIWEFPISIIKSFTEIYIATYMFKGSQMYGFLQANKLDFELIRFGNKPSDYKHLIDIVHDRKMNSYAEKHNSLSHSDLITNKHNDIMRKSMNTFFKSKNKTKLADRIWTTYKSAARHISGGNYSGCWVAFNTKATNDYQHTWCVAYMLNLYPNPMIKKILSYKNVEISQDEYSLSEMIQFIWRSRIRNNQPIKLYIPSSRMRNLLIRWLDDEFQ